MRQKRGAYFNANSSQNNGGAAIGLDKADNLWLPDSGNGTDTPGQADYFGVPLWDTSSPKIGSAHEIDSRIGHMFGEPMNGRLARVGSKAAKESGYKTENDLFYATVSGSGFNPPASVDEKGNSSYPAPSVYVLDSLGLDAGLSAKQTR